MNKNIYKVFFFIFLVLIFSDFLTYTLKMPWPLSFWRRQWFMFSYSNDKLSRLLVLGKFENGKQEGIAMERWFSYFVGFETSRYNEISRGQESLGQLATYVCRQYNQEAGPKEKLKSVSIVSAVWSNQKSGRQKLEEVPKKDVRLYPHLVKSCL